MMVLMTCQQKKPTKTQTVSFDFSGYENIELDSLESYAGDAESNSETEKKPKRLDLNGIQDEAREQKCLEEFLLDHQVQSLSDVEVLSLRNNSIQVFPMSVLRIVSLVTLDLSHNLLATIPHDIVQLIKRTGTGEYCAAILGRLNDDIKKKRTHMTTYSPYLAPSDYYLFANVKRCLQMLLPGALCGGIYKGEITQIVGGHSLLLVVCLPSTLHVCYKNLQELFLAHNALTSLPSTITKLPRLLVLRLAHNRLQYTPEKYQDMRARVPLSDGDKSFDSISKSIALGNLNLRSNRLKGNIILGNYGNLTELDVSDNAIESLDLSAVDKLQVLQCSRNVLVQLSVHGKHLSSLIAGNNKLAKLTVLVAPTGLRHVDVSYNELVQLPDWLSCCHDLRSLFASHNNIQCLPEHLFCNEMPYLHTLQLAYNQIQSLPGVPRRIPVQEMFLQNNSLSLLPENFFKAVYNVKVLNVSNNRLCELPVPEENCALEKLYLTANCLTDKTMNRIGAYMLKLRVFHGAYNSFTSIPEDCANCWPEIEELVLSGNKLLRLPESIASLKHLRVLRVHSNLLQTCPQLYVLSSLKVLDLAHNQLDRIDLSTLVPTNLKFLDLSCNLKLHVDSQQFQSYKTHRPMSLVDVSGRNRTSLPVTPSPFCENDSNNESSWTVGFSETAGCKQRLYISQIRLPAFCNTEALFGIFDGENNNIIPVTVDKVVPRILLEERTVKETAVDYMKYTMLSAHRELKDKSQKSGMSAIIVHIVKSKITADYSFCGGTRKYILRAASVGEIRAVIGRTIGPIRIIPPLSKKIRTSSQFPLLVPDPDTTEIYLDEQDEFMIIANKNLWDVMTPESAVAEVKAQRNVILAAKRLQDLAQSYGAEDNISVIVVHFSIIKSDVDQLMRELRQTIRKNKYHSGGGSTTTTTTATLCQAGCCCETNNSCSHCLEKNPQLSNNDDRSSPSGQSDHACSDCNSTAKLFIHQLNNAKQNELNRIGKAYESTEMKITPERRSYRGVARAVRAKTRDDDSRSREDTDSALSEEQFKCWEYMLEQNTQLLFDKELNTLSRGFKRHPPPLSKIQGTLSRSSPHLADPNPLPAAPLLNRQFGSSRSFNPLIARASARFTPERRHLVGGPNAAYFGSLQRLMPYNLEYDFAVMQERGIGDSIDIDRMNQYWGVTTTEL